MSGEEIKERIDFNNMMIQSLLTPNEFTLNNQVAKLLKENEELQAQCVHQFEDGYCVFCCKEEHE